MSIPKSVQDKIDKRSEQYMGDMNRDECFILGATHGFNLGFEHAVEMLNSNEGRGAKYASKVDTAKQWADWLEQQRGSGESE